MQSENYINYLIERYPCLLSIKEQIIDGYEILRNCYAAGNKVLISGNGGSAADAEHIVGELMKGFKKQRQIPDEFRKCLVEIDKEKGENLANKLQGALPTISLNNHLALNTAFLNDIDGNFMCAQQMYGYGRKGDVFLGISTSGNSDNIINAAIVAKALGLKIVILSGKDGGRLKSLADAAVIVPNNETYEIQELHLPIYHTWCLMLEEEFF